MRLLFVALIAIAIAGVARAEDPRAAAERLILDGNKLGEAGRMEEAIAKFREAQALFPHLGLAYARLKRWSLAHLRLDRAPT